MEQEEHISWFLLYVGLAPCFRKICWITHRRLMPLQNPRSRPIYSQVYSLPYLLQVPRSCCVLVDSSDVRRLSPECGALLLPSQKVKRFHMRTSVFNICTASGDGAQQS